LSKNKPHIQNIFIFVKAKGKVCCGEMLSKLFNSMSDNNSPGLIVGEAMTNFYKMDPEIQYSKGEHQGKKVIFIRFEYNKDLIERIKKLSGAKWSASNKCWYVPQNQTYLTLFGLESGPEGHNAILRINECNRTAYDELLKHLQLKAYSPNTIRTYRSEFAQLLELLGDHKVDDMSAERLKAYFLYCINTLKLSENTIHSKVNAIKFYFEQVLKREKIFIDIPRPKKKVILPNVLAVSQVEKLFSRLENLKHKTMLYLAYSAGLRVSEVVHLTIKDIHSERMVINIKGAKGKKDRTLPLSEGILELLREYYTVYKPKAWLFEGQYKDRPYSTRSLQKIFERAKNASKIKQHVSFHSLRHSYATHLHEAGTDIKLIQELLGHNDLKTTLRYTHVSNHTIEKVKSPFDNLNLKKND
jgi:site-specific recombinase XerD